MGSNLCFRSHIWSFLFIFLVSAAVSFAETNDESIGTSSLSSTLQFPKTQADKLIRSLNLFPKHDVNHHHDGGEEALGASPIVEKPVRFPFVVDSGASVQDLGHHAGYYKLPHTKDARYVFCLLCYYGLVDATSSSFDGATCVRCCI